VPLHCEIAPNALIWPVSALADAEPMSAQGGSRAVAAASEYDAA
jgi:hypothetical protein